MLNKKVCFREVTQKILSEATMSEKNIPNIDPKHKSYIIQEMRLQNEEDSEPLLILIEDDPPDIASEDSDVEIVKHELDQTENMDSTGIDSEESGIEVPSHGKSDNRETQRQKAVRTPKRKLQSLVMLVSHMRYLKLMSDEDASILIDNFNGDQEMFRRVFSRKSRNASPKVHSSDKYFATTFHFLSPGSYHYTRSNYISTLPAENHLCRWYCSSDGKPGFSSEALKFLATTKKTGMVIFQEMPLRQYEEICQGHYYGNVDFGCPVLGDSMPVAKKVLVFMFVCMNDTWKLPFGYIFVADMTVDQKKAIVTMCLLLLKQSDVTVTNITFDETWLGCFTFWEMCGSYTVPDPASMMMAIKNYLRDKGSIKSDRGEIDTKYVVDPGTYHEEDDDIENSISPQLDNQPLSDSIEDALLFFRNERNVKKFMRADATIDFISLLNEVMSIFNAKKVSDSSDLEWNITKIVSFYNYFRTYLRSLRFEDGSSVYHSDRGIAFDGLLRGLFAIPIIYKIYVKERKLLEYIPIHRCNLEHIKQFFQMFKMPDSEETPTCLQFATLYKHILLNDGNVNYIPIVM